MDDRQEQQRPSGNGSNNNTRRYHRSTAPPSAPPNDSHDNDTQSSTPPPTTTVTSTSLNRRQSMRRMVQRAIAAGISPSNDAVWTITTVESPLHTEFEMEIEGEGEGHSRSSSGSQDQFPVSTTAAARVRIRPTNVSRQPRGSNNNHTINTLRQLTFAPDGTFPSTSSINIPIGGGSAGAGPNNAAVNRSSTTISGNPALRHKLVYRLHCTYCDTFVCNRAMRAILLADVKVELYSTDIPPTSCSLLHDDRQTQGCNCRIRDAACTGCGCVLGYHVSQPCERCLEARNNGHFWMFYAEGVRETERKTHVVSEVRDGREVETPLYWNMLQPMVEEAPVSCKFEVSR